MPPRQRFDFMKLAEPQKVAVYHNLGVFEKLKLRRASKFFAKKPVCPFLMATRFCSVEVSRRQLRADRLPCGFRISRGLGNQPETVDISLRNWMRGLQLQINGFSRRHLLVKEMQGMTAHCDFLNRLTDRMLPHQVTFSHDGLELGGGPVRDTLKILSGSFTVHHRAGVSDASVSLLREERLLTRQPNILHLHLGDCPAIPETSYSIMFEQIAHIPIIGLTMDYASPKYWQTAWSVVVALLEAALDKHRPIGLATRYIQIGIVFEADADLHWEDYLPAHLIRYIASRDGINDVVTIFQGGQESDDTGDIFFSVVVAQNYARRVAELRAVQRRMNGNKMNSWQQKWPAR